MPAQAHKAVSSALAPDAETMGRFLDYCHRRRYPARADVFRPGSPATSLYYVVSGSLSVVSEETDGRELVLGYVNEGEFIGEMGLFFAADQRSVVVRTRSPCELAEINYERLHHLFAGPLQAVYLAFCAYTWFATPITRALLNRQYPWMRELP